MDYTQKAVERFYNDNYAVRTTGIKIDFADKNFAKCSLQINDSHLNTSGFVMGGAIFTLADYAFGVAANIDCTSTVTLTSTINFVAPTKGPMLYAEARCIKSGRNICFFEVTVTDDSGKVIASLLSNGFRNNK